MQKLNSYYEMIQIGKAHFLKDVFAFAYPRKQMGTDGAATVDQAVIELTQSGTNAMLGGPAGSVGDHVDGLDGHGICAVQIDGIVWVHWWRNLT